MNRYSTSTGSEGEYEPGSHGGVLKNLMGIKSLSAMHRVEDAALTASETQYFESGFITAETRITSETICRMHRDWLGSIYDWAGRYRIVDMSKGDFWFPPAWLVPQNMERFEREITATHTPCRKGPLETVGTSLAIVHAELLLIHPQGGKRQASPMARRHNGCPSGFAATGLWVHR